MRAALVLVLLVFPVHALISDTSRPQEPKKIALPEPVELKSGYYAVVGEGYDMVGSIGKMRDIYVVRWYGGEETIYGPAKRLGNQLAVGFAGSRVRGTMIFDMQADGKLIGKYTSIPGDGRWHEEQWTYLKPFLTKSKDNEE